MKDKLKTRKMQEERTLLVVTRLCVATKLQFFSFAVLLFAFFFLGTDAFMTGPRTTNETFVGDNYIVSFPEVPNNYAVFKAADGSIIANASSAFYWGSFDEIDNSTGTAVSGGQLVVVQSLNLSDTSLVWTESVGYPTDSQGNQYKNVNFSTSFPNGVNINFAYYYFSKPHYIFYPYLNESRTLQAGTFKTAIQMTGWKPINMSNLFMVRGHSVAEPFFNGDVQHVLNGSFYTITFNIGDGGITEILNIIEDAVIKQNVPLPVTWYSEVIGLVFTPELRAQGFNLFFAWPNFVGEMYYDPDFSVLITEGGSSGDGGSSATTTILVSVLVPVFVVGALLVIVVGMIISFFIVRSRRHRLSKMASMNQAESEVPEPAD